jgi:hypothetical protein
MGAIIWLNWHTAYDQRLIPWPPILLGVSKFVLDGEPTIEGLLFQRTVRYSGSSRTPHLWFVVSSRALALL